jgi:hypothetical protein
LDLDAGWLDKKTLVMPTSETRSSENTFLSGASKVLEALAFVASHGKVEVVVVAHG